MLANISLREETRMLNIRTSGTALAIKFNKTVFAIMTIWNRGCSTPLIYCVVADRTGFVIDNDLHVLQHWLDVTKSIKKQVKSKYYFPLVRPAIITVFNKLLFQDKLHKSILT